MIFKCVLTVDKEKNDTKKRSNITYLCMWCVLHLPGEWMESEYTGGRSLQRQCAALGNVLLRNLGPPFVQESEKKKRKVSSASFGLAAVDLDPDFRKAALKQALYEVVLTEVNSLYVSISWGHWSPCTNTNLHIHNLKVHILPGVQLIVHFA